MYVGIEILLTGDICTSRIFDDLRKSIALQVNHIGISTLLIEFVVTKK